jgi:preprotein translocase subunit Sec63
MRRSVAALAVLLLAALAHLTSAVRDMKFYKTLGVAADASDAEIKKAYRKAALCARF